MLISVGGKQLGLDKGKCEIPFLSHAHSDHTSGMKKKEKIIATQATIDLARLNAEAVTYPETEMLNAGHILGSTQLWAETDGGTVLYTGDFRTENGIFTKGATPKEADKLIIESTYGNPAFSFPPLEETYSKISSWVKSKNNSILVFGAYSLGKTQELIGILNQYCDVVPVVTSDSEHFNSVYEKHGISLERAVVGTPEAEEIMRDPFVAITSPRIAKRSFASKLSGAFNRKVYSASVSGWVQKYNLNVDIGFPLSDHSDYEDILNYVGQVNPKEVVFVHGDGSYLTRALNKQTGIVSVSQK